MHLTEKCTKQFLSFAGRCNSGFEYISMKDSYASAKSRFFH